MARPRFLGINTLLDNREASSKEAGNFDQYPKNEFRPSPFLIKFFNLDAITPKTSKIGGRVMTREEVLREAERRGYEYEQKYRV
jgi:hypothetical protein